MKNTIRLSIVLIIVYLIRMYLQRKTNNEIVIETNEPELKIVKTNEEEINEDEINEEEMK